MNLARFNRISYKDGKTLNNALKSPFYKSHALLVHKESENPRPKDFCFEVVQRKRKCTDQIPVQVAFFILSNAKMRMLEFFNLLRVHCDMTQMKLVYMGE